MNGDPAPGSGDQAVREREKPAEATDGDGLSPTSLYVTAWDEAAHNAKRIGDVLLSDGTLLPVFNFSVAARVQEALAFHSPVVPEIREARGKYLAGLK